MRYLRLAALMLFVGCADSHPGASRLNVGTMCVTTAKDLEMEGESNLITTPAGTRCTVEEDAANVISVFAEFAAKDGTAPPWLSQHPEASRQVTVTVLDGPTRGKIIKVARFHLRPTP
jgi:hypothetical protein